MSHLSDFYVTTTSKMSSDLTLTNIDSDELYKFAQRCEVHIQHLLRLC